MLGKRSFEVFDFGECLVADAEALGDFIGFSGLRLASWLNMLRSTVMMGVLSAMALSFYLVFVNMSNVCFRVLFR